MQTLQHPPQPSCFEEFKHINRYWDSRHQIWVAKILPGEYYVANGGGEAIATTLGSCVSACIRDTVIGIGGMNHFMLPSKGEHSGRAWVDSATRYGSYAMESLINHILKNSGQRKNLEIKLTGGGKILHKMSDVGEKNIRFALHYFATEGLAIAAQDLGDIYPRKVIYYPDSGRLRVKRIRALHNDTVLERESRYQSHVDTTGLDSQDVELF